MNKLLWRSSLAGGTLALTLLALQTQYAPRSTSAIQQPTSAHLIAADVEYPASERALVASAQVILIGTPTDAGRAVSKNEDTFFADYYQTIQVEQVLKGSDPGSTIQIVRAGTVQADQSQIVREDDEMAGPLAQERQILFLGPSAEPSIFLIIGHTSGAMELTKDGHVAKTRPELKGFAGLDIAAIQGKIRELEPKQ